MKALVTDSRYRMSLAVIRSLGRSGAEVTAAEDLTYPRYQVIGFHSRYVSHRVPLASAAREPLRFLEEALQICPGHDVFIPVSLAGVMTVSEHAREFRGRTGVLVPPFPSIIKANDTAELLGVASAIGVPVPATTCQGDGETAAELAGRLQYPVVIKYRRGEDLQLGPSQRYAIVRDGDRFQAVYSHMSANQERPLVQEYVPGEGFGVSALFDQNSRPVVWFAHRRIREYPASGGPSCFCESVWEPRMVAYALKLLTELAWTGVAMVEFKQDADSEFRLMEINPRFWGSLPLAIAAGVDFPLLLARLAAGETHPLSGHGSPIGHGEPAYRQGVCMRYLFQDMLSVKGYMRKVPERGRFLREFTRDLFDSGVVDGVFDRDDMCPGFFYTLRAAARVLPRRLRGSGGDD